MNNKMLNQLSLDYELDHIGIAVNTLTEGAGFYLALGYKMGPVEVVETEKVRVQMYELKNQSRIELLEPTAEDSPIGRFLQKRGPGIHHYCLRVKNIRKVLQQLKENNIQLINKEPVAGAHDCQVAFIHPCSAGGVLIELSEKRSKP